MALYAIGDVQGCYSELCALLKTLKFSPDRDRIWFVGDLVNRGPDSLKVLRKIHSMGSSAIVTLGNHDLHLLSVSFGCASERRDDTLEATLEARDRDVLLEWLITRPLLHEDPELNLMMLHAGLPPQWDLDLARRCAREFENALRRNPQKLFKRMYGDLPDRWRNNLAGEDRLRFIVNCFTRLRYVDADGRLVLDAKKSPKKSSKSLIPWFEAKGARWHGSRILFGHWSTLGFFSNQEVTSLDTGCVWGGSLTALRLDTPNAEPVHVACAAARTP
jgi:bis(5'-nucleosyl)-tetraphosphatase (symmetrical)